MSKLQENMYEDIFLAWREMHNDSMNHNPVYFNGAMWNPTHKVIQKLKDPDSIKDIASSSLNGHFGEFPTTTKIYQEYRRNLVSFIENNKVHLSLDISDDDPYKSCCVLLYELCLLYAASFDTNGNESGEYAKIIVQTPMHETSNSFIYKDVRITWGHVVAMWSSLTVLGNSFDLFKERDVVTVMDLGCGSGRMGYLLCKAFPGKISYVACDLPASAAIAQSYLASELTSHTLFSYDNNKSVERFTKKYLENNPGIHIVCAHDITKFCSKSIDVVMNIYSLGEMPPAIITMYHQQIQKIGNLFYSLNNRNFDYSAGTGFFRDYHVPKKTRHRPVSCTLNGNMKDGSPSLRQWPPWPAPSVNLTPGDMSPPWSDLYFEEMHYLPGINCGEIIDQLISEGYPLFDNAGTQVRVPLRLSDAVIKVD